MKKVVLFGLVAALAAVGMPTGFAHAQTVMGQVKLMEQNGSGENGTATFALVDATHVRVTINVSNGSSTPQPAHIHPGTCANLNPKPLIPLNNVVNGMSVTDIDLSTAKDANGNPLNMQSMMGSYAINIHKSAAEVSTYVACGDLSAMTTGGDLTPPTPIAPVKLMEQNGSGQNGTATFTLVDDAHVRVTINVSNGSSTPQPAHIHPGTCANLNPKPLIPLSNVVNGVSVTDIDVNNVKDANGNPLNMDNMTGDYAINIHKSAAEVSVYVACGDLTAMTTGGETGGTGATGNTGGTTPGMPRTGTADLPLFVGGLGLLALALAGAGLRLRHHKPL
jgi:hypothetical protein